jgi:hypothetical protein
MCHFVEGKELRLCSMFKIIRLLYRLPRYVKCGLWVVAPLVSYMKDVWWLKRFNNICLVTADVRSLCFMAGTVGMYSNCA